MKRLVRRGLTLGVLAATAAVAAPVPVVGQESGSTGPATGADAPLQAAGRAAQTLSFVGVLQVRWSEDGRERSESLVVHGANGSLVVKGGTAVMASSEQRLVEHAGGGWNLLWPAGDGGADRPPASQKYDLVSQPGPLVANRTSQVVEVRSRAGDLVERLYLDQQTDLLLRREQFEDGAGPFRTVGFETVTIGAGVVEPPPPPVDFKNAAPQVLSANRLPAGVSAPVALADGYQRVGLYRRSGVVHAVYSDGLYDLSVFEQQGTLDRRGLPASRVDVGDHRGWHYSWPGGHVLLWEDQGTVYTAVSDAPLDQVVTAVQSLPPAGVSPSLLRRLRQVARALVQPLAA